MDRSANADRSFPRFFEPLEPRLLLSAQLFESALQDLDWGDAPDSPFVPGYPTLAAHNGANHVIAGPWFGDRSDVPDGDANGQPHPYALGDDLDGNDDEDGVIAPTLVQGQSVNIRVDVAGGGGFVQLWIDFNGDMTWQHPGEQVFAGPLADGPHLIPVTAPVGSVVGQTFLRARITTQAAMPLLPTGPAPDGEVEDHEVYITEITSFPKWEQYPEPAQPDDLFYGWNEESVYGGRQIVADDWVCTTMDPVTDVHWWGSYIGWDYADQLPTELPSGFHIAIWTDVPVGPGNPDPFSHPGEMIWEVDCTNFTSQFVGWDFDPVTETYEACFRFNQILRPEEYFEQDPSGTDPNIYWISIAATYTGGTVPQYPWGWKTRPRDSTSPAPDDAVRIFDPNAPVLNDPYVLGEPIEELGISWDMAFELTTLSMTPDYKWEQLPDLQPTGMDVLDGPGRAWTYEKFLADDFRCDESGLITDVTLWGSYKDDVRIGAPPLFTLAIYDDIPAAVSPTGYSMPGNLLWSWYGLATENQYATTFQQFFDPNANDLSGIHQIIYQYDFIIDDATAFQQDQGTIYWLGVHHSHDVNGDGIVDLDDADAILNSGWAWGWHTSPDEWNDTAVWTDVQSDFGGSGEVTPPAGNWSELIDPNGDDLDMAFQLGNQGIVKWVQLPGTAVFQYVDVLAGPIKDPDLVYEKFLADDFQCTATGPITEITFWGSYFDDIRLAPPAPPLFNLAIYKDIPADESPTGYSMPGALLWHTYQEADVEVLHATALEDFYDPNLDWIIGQDTQVWQYTFHIDPQEAFYQTDGDIYWLGIHHSFDLNGDGIVNLADYSILLGSNWSYGWKTSEEQWNDDAVWTDVDSSGTSGEIVPPNGPWSELRYPAGHVYEGESIDLAFRMSGVEAYAKWSQPPEPYVPDDAYYGWDEYSVYDGDQIVADDWFCDTEQPVTDIHWWGSYIGWFEPDPPGMPQSFHIGIWTDEVADPADPNPFSHPRQMVWETYCDQFTWQFAGWDFDPRDPLAPPEATFLFSQDIPESEWFLQEPGDNIYWVSISAVYPLGVPQHPWGWKTRPQDPTSPAPDDAVRIFDPNAPVLNDPYVLGEPIWWPDPDASWDTAFVLTTRDVDPPEVVDVRVNGTTWNVLDYSIPVAGPVQFDALGWSNINQVEIFFSEDVIVQMGDLSLTGNGGPYAFSNFSYDPIAMQATWTLAGIIPIDSVVINLSDAVEDYALNALDGDWTDQVSTYPSGDGIAGGNFIFTFKVLHGDANGDKIVDLLDLTILANNWMGPATSFKQADFNGDAIVDLLDLVILANNWNQIVASPGGSAGVLAVEVAPPGSVAFAGGSGGAKAAAVVTGRLGPVTAGPDLLTSLAGGSGPAGEKLSLAAWQRVSADRANRRALPGGMGLLEEPDLSVFKPVL